MGASNDGNAKSVTLSLYQRHIDKVQKHRGEQKYGSDAASLQNIIDSFEKKVSIKKDFIILFLFPVVLCGFSLFCSISLSRIIDALVVRGVTDIGELLFLETVYGSLGFVTLGILGMCFVVFFGYTMKKEKK